MDESKDICSICKTVVSRGGKAAKSYNTTNLRKHLEVKHPEEHRRLEASEKEAAKVKVGFAHLMRLVEPCYKIPSDKYFSETLIPQMYESV